MATGRWRRQAPGPQIDPRTGAVCFVLDYRPDERPASIWFHLRDFGADTRFRRRGRQWVATIPRPAVARMEYLVVFADQNGHEWMAPDPSNPLRARGAFGEHSLIEFPDYARPAWLDHPDPVGTAEPFHAVDPATNVRIGGAVWTPAGFGSADPLPLLVVHDGPEYADLASLLRYTAHLARHDARLSCRVLLLQPEDRNRIYSASPAYSRLLTGLAIPQVRSVFATRDPLVGVGASLGALALTHAAVSSPGCFGGLFLQSGSFFRPIHDPQERRFRFYDRVVRFVDELHDRPDALAGLALSLTCGTGEENLTNNRALVERLQRHGLVVEFTQNLDGHNYTGWRDCLDPALAELLDRLW